MTLEQLKKINDDLRETIHLLSIVYSNKNKKLKMKNKKTQPFLAG